MSTAGSGARRFFGFLNALFDLADARQVLVQLLLIAAAQFFLQRAGVVEHEIEHRSLLLLPQLEARFAMPLRAGAEQPFEHQPRIRFRRDRRRRDFARRDCIGRRRNNRNRNCRCGGRIRRIIPARGTA